MKRRLVAALAGLLLCPAGAMSAEIEGVKLADTVRVGEPGRELVLNGAGLRTRMVFKVYVGALYLPQKTTSVQAVLADAGPRRVALHMLRELTAEQFFSALNDGLKANHAPGDLAKLDAQLQQLQGIFNEIKAAKTGDSILIDYLPGTGTRITFNGAAKGTIPGEDFNRALLRVWLGDQPADAGLKKAMLGG